MVRILTRDENRIEQERALDRPLSFTLFYTSG